MSDEPDLTPRRLDIELVRRNLMPSRAQARAAIEAGKVLVDGAAATKPGMLVLPAAAISAEAAHPWVSRGGVKLAHALDVFEVDCRGLTCLDVGASTGGFTDVLLARGAKHVTAVDVGRDQLHPRLGSDSRVASLESTDARMLTAEMLPAPPELIVCDASFIGLSKVLGPALRLAAPGAWLVALFKPQFEVGPANVGRGGIVSDFAAADAAARDVEVWIAAEGWIVVRWIDSPILGSDGNRERLFLAENRGSAQP